MSETPKTVSCKYATLSNYNMGFGAGAVAPVPAGTPSMSTVIVPNFGAPGYDTLQHGKAGSETCGNHFSIKNAYPQFPNSCTTFTSRQCSN